MTKYSIEVNILPKVIWDFIQQGKNSLKRYNNWWIFLNELEAGENK